MRTDYRGERERERAEEQNDKGKFKKCRYLSSAKSDHQVSNEGVLCLSRAMANHHTPAIGLRHFTPANAHTHTHVSLGGS